MPYRFAIIGCGHVAHRHVAAIQKVGRLVAACDTFRERAQTLCGSSGARIYSDLSTMLAESKPDIVSVCSPSGLHYKHSVEALAEGAHVICEKPMALSSSDAGEMLAAAVKYGRKLFIVKQNRYNQPVQMAKTLLETEKLGKIHAFNVNCAWNRDADYYEVEPWRGTRLLGGGTLFTQFSHFIDIIYWYLGGIKEVSGWRANFLHKNVSEFEDTGAATMLMQSGAIGNLFYTINAHKHNMEGAITLFGDRGTIKIGGPYLNRIDHFAVEGERLDEWELNIPERQEKPHETVYLEISKALANPVHHYMSTGEAVASLEMIEAIYRASPLLP